MAVVGASQLAIPVAVALPAPPDIPELGEVPGGTLFACTPYAWVTNVHGAVVGEPLQGTIGRTQYPLSFGVRQGFIAVIRRVHLRLPVFIEELALEKHEEEETSATKYKTEEEAVNAAAGAGGSVLSTEHSKPLTPLQPYEKLKETFTTTRAGSEVKTVTKRTTEKSVLPVAIQVVAALIGPEGHIWAETNDVDLTYFSGVAGKATGYGLLDTYYDLVNPIPTDQSNEWGLGLSLRVPGTVKTNPQIGTEVIKKGQFGLQSSNSLNSEVIFFYDLEDAPVHK